MTDEAKQRKVAYNVERRKQLGIKKFGADFLPEEYKKIDDCVKRHGMTKVDFIRYAYKKLKEEEKKDV